MKPTDKIFCNIYGIRFQMYYKMRILPVIFLFSMMTKAQDNFILGFLIHGVNLILNKGMTGIWIARRYWLSIRSQYIHQYIMYFGGGARLISRNLLFRCILCPFGSYFSPFWHYFINVICYFLLFLNFSSMINLILVTFLPVLIGSNSIFISVNSLISVCAFSKTFTRKSL